VADPSPTAYARCGDAHVAYRVCGDGPPDLVLALDWFSHVGEMWAPSSPLLDVLMELASFGRLVTFDRRGVGMSDPVPLERLPTLEQWMDDLAAVMDGVGMERAALVAKGSSGAMSMLFAASHPDRVSHLVLVNSYARLTESDDYPFGIARAEHPSMLEGIYPARDAWRLLAGRGIDESTVRWLDRYVHYAAPPATVLTMRRMLLDVDVRGVLGSIQAPTLVLHRQDNPYIRVEHGRHLASCIPGARIVELPGRSDLIIGDDPALVVAEIQTFLTGERPAARTNSVLATVLYTDLVDSTDRAAKAGDRAWRVALDHHDHAVRTQLDLYGGREVKTTGDGFLALFDGPTRAIGCAAAVRRVLRESGFEIRAGIHTGEVELRGDDISGLTVNLGQRIQALAATGEILVSSVVKELALSSGVSFRSRGEHLLKGAGDRAWEVFAAAP